MLLSVDKTLIKYLAKFLIAFSILYYGTTAFIGLATPGNYYSSFIDHYFAYYRWLRDSLLYSAKFALSFFGFDSEILFTNHLKIIGGRFVIVSYDCLGYGVISFWLAFVFANSKGLKIKLMWMIFGGIALWLINVARISIFLVAVNKKWHMPFGWSHHTWFNIISYGLIFCMIFLYDKKNSRTVNQL